MKQIRYGLIGCGSISSNHLKAAKENGLEIVALCDLNEGAAKDRAEQFALGALPLYTDYTEMLRRENLDLVTIAAASGARTAIALDCLRENIPIILEKPIALSLSDADAILAMSRQNGVSICACHQNRLNPSVQKARSAIEKGHLGKLLHATAHIRWNRNEDYYKQAGWRGTWEYDGGALMNQCIHSIDILRWVMGGEIDEVFAYTDRLAHPYIEAEDLGIALIRFSNGSYGIIEGTTNIYPSNYEETLYVFGTEGTVKLGGKSLDTIETWMLKGSEETPQSIMRDIAAAPGNLVGHSALYKDIAEAIQDGRKPYIDVAEGRSAVELVLAIYQSAATGQPVKLPIGDCATKDFIGRFK